MNQWDFHPMMDERIISAGDDRFINEPYHDGVIRIQGKNEGRIE
ncbi:hypothetical protein ACFLU8_02920 [Chloroflexota bacterium]